MAPDLQHPEFLIIGTVLARAKQDPANKTAFMVRAIENEPFVFQQLLDGAVLA